MRVCAQVLCYNVTPFIVPMLDNLGPHVERIYVAYSPRPYAEYNPAARDRYQNPTPVELLGESRFFDKIRVIKGDWANETDQRNECLAAARADGMDIMLIQDADEFFFPEDYQRNISEIVSRQDIATFSVPWYLFWKNQDYVVKHLTGELFEYSACYAINLVHTEACFERRRMSSPKPQHQLSGRAYHLAYVYDNAGMRQKLETWSHSADSDRDNWYGLKWETWTEKTRFIHPFMPCYYDRAVRFEGPVPPEMMRVPRPPLEVREKTLREAWRNACYDLRCALRHRYRLARSHWQARRSVREATKL